MTDKEDLRGLQKEEQEDKEAQYKIAEGEQQCERCNEWFCIEDLEDGICGFCEEDLKE